MLTRWLQARRERRDRAERDAAKLLLWMGDHAYREARERARACRRRGDRAGDRHWGRVACLIADQAGIVVGEKVADRYERTRQEEAQRPAGLPREIAAALADVAEGIADLARGRGNATTVHNIGARVRHVIAMGGSTSTLVLAGDDVIAACEDLALAEAECAQALAAGVYPEPAEKAGEALRRFRGAVAQPR